MGGCTGIRPKARDIVNAGLGRVIRPIRRPAGIDRTVARHRSGISLVGVVFVESGTRTVAALLPVRIT